MQKWKNIIVKFYNRKHVDENNPEIESVITLYLIQSSNELKKE